MTPQKQAFRHDPANGIYGDPIPAFKPAPCAGALNWFAWRKQRQTAAMAAPKPWMVRA